MVTAFKKATSNTTKTMASDQPWDGKNEFHDQKSLSKGCQCNSSFPNRVSPFPPEEGWD